MRAAFGAVTVAVAIGIGACGGDDGEGSPEPGGSFGIERLQQDRIGTMSSLDCSDWNRADVGTKADIIDAIEGFVGGELVGSESRGSYGNTLEDERAYELFENTCEQEVADAFVLYKLYSHAAAFGAVETTDEGG